MKKLLVLVLQGVLLTSCAAQKKEQVQRSDKPNTKTILEQAKLLGEQIQRSCPDKAKVYKGDKYYVLIKKKYFSIDHLKLYELGTDAEKGAYFIANNEIISLGDAVRAGVELPPPPINNVFYGRYYGGKHMFDVKEGVDLVMVKGFLNDFLAGCNSV